MIGTGNVASVIGDRIHAAGHSIIQVWGRNTKMTQEIATNWNASFTCDWNGLDHSGDIYIYAVSDEALYHLQEISFLKEKLLVHTAGAVSMQVLNRISNRTGVLYPLQSLRKNITSANAHIPLLITSNNSNDLLLLQTLADSISEGVKIVDDAQRLQLHLAAVMVNNFTNHLYTLAERYCSIHDLPFDQLQPLIEETALRLRNFPPHELQTGPASRHDHKTIETHLDLLKDTPDIQEMYQWMSTRIMNKP